MDMFIIRATERVVGVEATTEVTDNRAEAKSGTGVRMRVKGNLLISPIPNTDSNRSAETRRITMEVGWYESKEGGGGLVWGNGNSVKTKISKFIKVDILRGVATSIITHSS